MLKCKNEHEEKKVKFLGNIYANVAFMPEITIAGAYWLLQKGEELTYRQMCMLTIIEQKGKDHKWKRGVSYGPKDGDPAFELEYTGLADMLYIETDPSSGEHNIQGLKRAGRQCYKAMGLSEIPEGDLRQLSQRFTWAFKD